MTDPTAPAEDPDFVAALAAALARLEEGETLDLDALCDGRPDLVQRVEAALERRDDLAGLHRAATVFDPLLGSLIDNRYELQERLGAGGMGIVYAAADTALPRSVAIKLLRPELFDGSELRARFDREAEVLAKVQHPAIVSVIDRGVADGNPYIVMEQLHGLSAADLLRAADQLAETATAPPSDTGWVAAQLGASAALEPSYVRQAVRWVAQIAGGLDVAHRAGIIHRDVKPSNVYLRQNGEAVLIDFGIVTLGDDVTLLRRDQAIGTPSYMAPEQLDPRPPATPATDVYGLCATLYHLLTFRRPYEGSPSQVLAQLQRRDPTPAQRLRPGLPRDLLAVLDKGLARDPAHRYPTAAALADDLTAWLEFRPVTARPIGPVRRAWRRGRRSVVARTLAVTALVLATALGISSYSSARHQERQQKAFDLGFSRIGPTLLQGLPGQRVPAPAAAVDAMRAALDNYVEWAPRVHPARLYRAMFWLDQGDRAEAARDFAAVAEAEGSIVCDALATMCAVGDATAEPSSLDLTALSEPNTGAGALALALMHIRHPDRDRERAVELLRRVDEDLPGVTELRLLIEIELSMIGRDAQTILDRARSAHVIAVQLEDALRGPSALALYLSGVTLQLQNRWTEAAESFDAAAKLADYDFQLWSNVAGARLLAREFVPARAAAEQAIALEPSTRNGHEQLIKSHIELGDYQAAEAAIEQAPFPQGGGQRRHLSSLNLLLRAAATNHRREREALAARAADGLTGWNRLVALTMAGEAENSFPALVEGTTPQPLHWWRLSVLAQLIPPDPEPGDAKALIQLLRAIANALAPDSKT